MPSISPVPSSVAEQNGADHTRTEQEVESRHDLPNGISENHNAAIGQLFYLSDPRFLAEQNGAAHIRTEEEVYFGDELPNGISENHNTAIEQPFYLSDPHFLAEQNGAAHIRTEEEVDLGDELLPNGNSENHNLTVEQQIESQMIVCQFCGEQQHSIYTAFDHLSLSHPEHVATELCPICDNFVVTDENYAEHATLGPPIFGRFHGRRHPFSCPFCSDWDAFRYLRWLRDHIHYLHSNPNRFCRVCQREVNIEQDFADHMMNHVFHSQRTYAMRHPNVTRPSGYYAESSLGIRSSGGDIPASNNPPDATEGS